MLICDSICKHSEWTGHTITMHRYLVASLRRKLGSKHPPVRQLFLIAQFTFLLRCECNRLEAAEVTLEAAQQLPRLYVPQPGHLITSGSHLRMTRDNKRRLLLYEEEFARSVYCINLNGAGWLGKTSSQSPGNINERIKKKIWLEQR